ncbi:plasmid partition protein ParG [Nostoc sp. MG11]|uniref:plasmid partition protein ParG n=1 Tax=Nostoc sp. MG11 TaxID=2721166 RepID=UPI0039B6F4C1
MVILYIPKELKIKFKTICAKQDTTMSQVVKEFIEKWVIENVNPKIGKFKP